MKQAPDKRNPQHALVDTEMLLNKSIRGLSPSSTLYINEEVNRLWQAGERVFHLGFGESRFGVHPKLQAALADHAHSKSYLPARGLPALCEAVATYHGEKLGLTIKPDQVIVGPGSKALIYALQMSLDADLYLPTPSWVSYAPQARLLNKPVYYIPSRVEDNHKLDLRQLDAQLRMSDKPQKLLVISSPNNPTGQMLDDGFLKELAAFCRQHNVLVISDEIYFLVRHGDIKHVSIARYYPEGSFILSGLSKHLSIGGWRLGVAILPDNQDGQRVMEALKSIASETWSAVASPMQYAALAAYSGDPDIEDYIQQCSAIHGIRTRYFYQQLGAMGISSTKPQGAFYLTVNFDRWAWQLQSKGIRTSPELARQLLSRQHIASLAADSFGIPETTLSLRLATSYLDMEKDEDSERLLSLYRSGIDEAEFMSPAHHPNLHACVAAVAEFIAWIES